MPRYRKYVCVPVCVDFCDYCMGYLCLCVSECVCMCIYVHVYAYMYMHTYIYIIPGCSFVDGIIASVIFLKGCA